MNKVPGLDIATVPLWIKGVVVSYATIDKADLHLVDGHRWRPIVGVKTAYAMRSQRINGRSVTIYMHRAILGVPHGAGHRIEVDHLNYDGLDNRRENIRMVSHSENVVRRRIGSRNRSGHVGVHYLPRRLGRAGGDRWVAELQRNNVVVLNATFKTRDEAIAARRLAEQKFPPSPLNVGALT